MIEKAVVIHRAKAKDAKPVAKLVQMASGYRSAIHLKSGKYNVNAKSIMGMMLLGFAEGDEICVTAEGADEREAVSQIEEYLTCAN